MDSNYYPEYENMPVHQYQTDFGYQPTPTPVVAGDKPKRVQVKRACGMQPL